MKVSAIVVTRGDVDLDPILESIPPEWEMVVWSNNDRHRAGAMPRVQRWPANNRRYYTYGVQEQVDNLSVYGRYAAIGHASGDAIYVQDDDVIVSDPRAIVRTLAFLAECPVHGEMARTEVSNYAGWVCRECQPMRFSPDSVVCNMPQEFRHDFYKDHALVGFGAAFWRDAPARAFVPFFEKPPVDDWFLRTCDIAFTARTPCTLVDVPRTNLEYAYGDDRMWRQPEHVLERAKMLGMARGLA